MPSADGRREKDGTELPNPQGCAVRPPRSLLQYSPKNVLAFARIVTHYISHNAWLEDVSLLRGATALADIPGILENGRFDFQAPIGNAWALKRVWSRAELWIVDDTGHSASTAGITSALVRATDHCAGLGEKP